MSSSRKTLKYRFLRSLFLFAVPLVLIFLAVLLATFFLIRNAGSASNSNAFPVPVQKNENSINVVTAKAAVTDIRCNEFADHSANCTNKELLQPFTKNYSSEPFPRNIVTANEAAEDEPNGRRQRNRNNNQQEEEFTRPIKLLSRVSSEYEDRSFEAEGTELVFHHSGNFRHSKAEIWDPHPQYRFYALGRQFHLILEQDSEFIHPNLKIINVSKNYISRTEPDINPKGCYYSGFLKDEPNSKVVVSLCDGMTGHIRSISGNYFIEPAGLEVKNNVKPFLHIFRKLDNTAVESNAADEDGEVDKADGHCSVAADTMNDLVNGSSLPSSSCIFSTNISNIDYASADNPEDQLQLQQQQHLRRPRRSASVSENTIELMIAVDAKMAEYHGAELHNYVLTLMSIVAKIYKDKSIGNPMHIAVVKIFVLSDSSIIRSSRSDGRSISIEELLKNFCIWQKHHNNRNDEHHDCALFLSRQHICKRENQYDCSNALGLARLGTMCQKESCAIVRDNGLSTAFTIAHELGHVLNMPHDDDTKCNPFKETGDRKRVMSHILGPNSHPWTWSACSRHYLTDFLDGGNSDCLHDNPYNDYLEESDNDGLPGESYTKDKQCELVYGKGYRICPHGEVCRSLWCTDSAEKNGCQTNGMPWAEGTPCGFGHWCQQGECIAIDRKSLQPVNGGWGQWQSFGECSRNCGGGIRKAYRECDNPPPKNGGKYCVGKHVKYQSCNIKECPPGAVDFRSEQCAKHNNNNFGVHNLSNVVQWLPHYHGSDDREKCKLYCRAAFTQSYYALEKVIDGTPCSPDTFDICVNGVCTKAGCDHILGSNSVLDTCGVCGGNNTTCKQMRKEFNETRTKYGYNRLTVIPAGASNLDIRQRGFGGTKDDNFLAIIDLASGTYLLNGNYNVVKFHKKIVYNSVTFDYSGSDVFVERINSTRPLHQDLILEVLSVGNLNPPDIICQYTVPISPADYFEWRVTEGWSVCDKVCFGKQEKIVYCIKKDTGNRVSSESCAVLPKPHHTQARMCNEHCSLSWKVVSKTECSTHCGTGRRTLTYRCYQEFFNSFYTSVELPDASCNHLDKPSELENCFSPCNEARWKYQEWKTCNVTCGNGMQEREAVCVDEEEKPIDERRCSLSEKITQKRCSMDRCPQWAVGIWSSCSVTCGVGTRMRRLWCQKGNHIVQPHLCSAVVGKPSQIETCEMPPCRPEWTTGKWSECSVSCGTGVVTRTVRCSSSSTANADGGEKQCAALRKPSESETCILTPCRHFENEVVDSNDFEWVVGDWESCSETCGKGIKKRLIACYEIHTRRRTEDTNCNVTNMPETRSACEERVCGGSGKWKTSAWSQCSATCGRGVSVRTTWCEVNETRVSDSECDERKPSSSSPCSANRDCSATASTAAASPEEKVPLLYVWRIGKWSECSAACGNGFQRRLVQCRSMVEGTNGELVTELFCDKASKPATQRECRSSNVCASDYTWVPGPWGECSESCGEKGKQKRKLLCFHRSGRKVRKLYCKSKKKLTRRRKCNIRRCEPTNCLDIKQQYRTETDRDYALNILGRNISIFCYQMRSSQPKEYLTLPAGESENYSEFFGKRMIDPDTCPPEGGGNSSSNKYNCPCIDETSIKTGKTVFSRIRINVSTLQVIVKDFTFAKPAVGSLIPFGEAGDCFSNGKCPQGSFSINLIGTGLRVAPSVTWIEDGVNASMKVYSTYENRKVVGTCGGYCAACRPNRGGLMLDVLPP